MLLASAFSCLVWLNLAFLRYFFFFFDFGGDTFLVSPSSSAENSVVESTIDLFFGSFRPILTTGSPAANCLAKML